MSDAFLAVSLSLVAYCQLVIKRRVSSAGGLPEDAIGRLQVAIGSQG